jgi:hypothetical protein
MQLVRQAERLFEEIRHLSHLFQVSCPEGFDSRRYKIKLVEVCDYDDRSNSRHVNED